MIKFRLYFLFFTVLLPFVSSAQDKNFQLGFTFTPNIGWAQINDGNPNYTSDGSDLGFSYGLIGDFGFSDNYFFSTAFTITSVNNKISIANSPNSENRTIKLQYIEVPLTIKLKTNEMAGKNFYGQFGLGTGIKVRGKYDSEVVSGGQVISRNEKQEFEDGNTFRLSLVAGAGVQWNLGESSKVITGFTFNNGFTNISDSSPFIRNSYFALNLGVMF